MAEMPDTGVSPQQRYGCACPLWTSRYECSRARHHEACGCECHETDEEAMSDALLTAGQRVSWPTLAPGDYAKAPDGTWYALTPNGYLANLAKHEVTEYEDGTITACPSILVTVPARSGERPPRELWHGFLERGSWRPC